MLNKYPLWKNSLLVVLLILGFIYAAPNLFPEQPAVQISPSTAIMQVNLEELQTKVNKLIKAAHIVPVTEALSQQTLIVSVANTDTQLKVKDILSSALGDDYTVAVNLISTPRWMQAIGAFPMKLGLDLRGGVHFALEVDINNLIAQRMQGLAKNISENLRQARIRYASLIPQEKQLTLSFRDRHALSQAKNLLQRQFPRFEFSEVTGNAQQLIVTWTKQGLNNLRQLSKRSIHYEIELMSWGLQSPLFSNKEGIEF